MDSAPDLLAASAPFPTIPTAAPSPRPRVAKPRHQAAAFRSNHPVASSPSRRPGGEFSSFVLGGATGAGSRPSTAGAGPAGSRPAAFVFTKSPRRRMRVAFTCNVCEQRTTRAINPHAYTDGTVFVQCCGCNIFHKLVDNLNLFHEMKCYVGPDFRHEGVW